MNRLNRACILLALIVAGLSASATDAFATHFRYGTITWSTPNPAQPNVIQVRFDSAWRRSFFGTPNINDAVSPGSLEILNAAGTANVLSPVAFSATVTAVNAAEDWISTTWTTTITLPPTPNADYLLRFTNCCRISSLRDGNNDQNFTVLSKVTVRSPINRPPTSASLPIITVPVNQSVNFIVPAFDPDGDALTYALSSTTESGMPRPAPTGSPALTINPSTGRVTWTPVTLGLYAAQFKITDTDGAFTVLDIIFSVASAVAAGSPPVVTVNSVPVAPTFNVLRGTPLNFSVAATTNTTPPSPVTLTSSSLPIGAAMSPSLPTSNLGIASSTFFWTPANNQVGSYLLQYAGVSASGLQTLLNVNINVTNNQPTILCTPIGTIAATGPAGAAVTINAALTDADDDLLNYELTLDGVIRQTANNVNPPATVPFTTTLGVGAHAYTGRVTDNFSPTVLCTGTITVSDLSPPSLSLPADMSVFASAASGATVSYSVTAHDAVDNTPSVSCTPGSGSLFPVGANTVTCTAADDAGNSVSGTFGVNVLSAQTNLSAIAPASVLVGGPLTMSATLVRTSAPAGALVGQPVVFTVTGPSPSAAVITVPGTTNAAGVASVTTPINQRGTYAVTADFVGANWLAPSSAASSSVAAYQRTALSIAPVTGVAGADVTVAATLLAMPQGTPLAGETVLLSFGGALLDVHAVTDAAGTASVTVNFPSAGAFPLTGIFNNAAALFTDAAGSIPPASSLTTTTATISSAVTSLALTAPSTGLVGDALSVSATVTRISAPSGPAIGNQVVFTLTGPSSAPATMTLTAVTDSTGAASVTFPPAAARGSYSISASFAGGPALQPAADTRVVSVYQRTALLMNTVHGIAGGATSMSASLVALPQNTPLPSQSITLSSTGNPGPPAATLLTDASGTATVSVVFPAAGDFAANATFVNLADFFVDQTGTLVATTAAAPVTIEGAVTQIAPLAVPPVQFVGGTSSLVAELTRVSAPSGPVANATLAFTLGGATSANASAQTIATGAAVQSFALTGRGQHTVDVQFAGDAALMSAATSVSFTVYQRAHLSLAPATGPAGSATDVTATLVTVPGGLPIAGQSIAFDFGGAAASQTAMTNAAGQATVSVVFATTGTYTATASFLNIADFFADHAGGLGAEVSSMSIVVTDSTPPVIVPHVSGTLGAGGYYTSDVLVTWTVTDAESAVTSVGCGLSAITSDSTGVTLTCSASSEGGSSSQSVTVKRDTQPPSQALPANLTVGATSVTGAVVSYTVVRNDATSGVAGFTCAPVSGSTFPIGATTVSCSVTDVAGHSTTGTFTVTVSDTIAPVIASTTPSASSMWPPDHRMVPITLSVSASDNLGPAPMCTITGITSNEPQNGLGDGDTPNDWLITGPATAQLRAERAGGGDGRIYTLAVRCVDAAGNAATSSTTVSVPKAQSK